MRPNPQETGYLAIFTEGILNGKRNLLCGDNYRAGLTYLENSARTYALANDSDIGVAW